MSEGFSEGWVDWTGSAKIPPLDGDTAVEIQRRDGSWDGGMAYLLGWEHVGAPSDILRYRVWHHEAKDAPIHAAQPQSEPRLPSDGWIDWSSGPCPVHADTRVEVRLRDASTYKGYASSFSWLHDRGWGDVISYRVEAVTPKAEPIHAALNTLTSEKLTNPKDAIGSVKLPLHLWPAEATALGCLGMLEGRCKYGRNNYIAGEGVIASIYVDAAKRHLDAWFSGEEFNPDLVFTADGEPVVGLSHLGNALACIAIIVKAQAHGKLIDDRDFSGEPGAYRKFVEQVTPLVKKIQGKFADKNPKHYTISDNPKEH